MKNLLPPQVAVLTGDLIGSTKVDAAVLESTLALLQTAAKDIGTWTQSDPRFTRFRGDGWQMVLTDPALALRAAVVILAKLRGSKTTLSSRISIGFGPVATLGTRDLSDASGLAFVHSGRGLDSMPRTQTLAVTGPGMTILHTGFVALMEVTLRRWTAEQAEAIAMYLHPDNPVLFEITLNIGITEQAVSQRIRGGHGHDLRQALKYWELDAAMIRATGAT